MTEEQETMDYRQSVITEDKHSRIESDVDEMINTLIYEILHINDILMNDVGELKRLFVRGGFFHHNIKQKVTELQKMISDNNKNKMQNRKAWGGEKRTQEELDRLADDGDILELLIKKFFGRTNKILFFGGCDASLGQKVWAMHPEKKKLVLARIDSATATVNCVPERAHFGDIVLHCTRLNEKTAAETKDKFDVGADEVYQSKEDYRKKGA